jgi:hypothetical protein
MRMLGEFGGSRCRLCAQAGELLPTVVLPVVL